MPLSSSSSLFLFLSFSFPSSYLSRSRESYYFLSLPPFSACVILHISQRVDSENTSHSTHSLSHQFLSLFHCVSVFVFATHSIFYFIACLCLPLLPPMSGCLCLCLPPSFSVCLSHSCEGGLCRWPHLEMWPTFPTEH